MNKMHCLFFWESTGPTNVRYCPCNILVSTLPQGQVVNVAVAKSFYQMLGG